MAAIVRSGARMLQRAPAASALLQRREASGVGSGYAAPPLPFKVHQQQHEAAVRTISSSCFQQQQHADEIQMKKEELYLLLSLTAHCVDFGFGNRRLMRALSAQVKPRPHDPLWRQMLVAKRFSDVIRPVGIVSGFALGAASILMLYIVEEITLDNLKEEQEEKKAAKDKELALLRG